jgi:hypothetical protein
MYIMYPNSYSLAYSLDTYCIVIVNRVYKML